MNIICRNAGAWFLCRVLSNCENARVHKPPMVSNLMERIIAVTLWLLPFWPVVFCVLSSGLASRPCTPIRNYSYQRNPILLSLFIVEEPHHDFFDSPRFLLSNSLGHSSLIVLSLSVSSFTVIFNEYTSPYATVDSGNLSDYSSITGEQFNLLAP